MLKAKLCDSPETAHVEEGIRIKPVTVGKGYFIIIVTIILTTLLKGEDG